MKYQCPCCHREVQGEGNVFRPFCSERCQIIDLAAWASEDYAIQEDSDTESSLSLDDSEM